MNKREKILAIITGSIICVIVFYTLANAMLLGPADALNSDIRATQKRIGDLRTAKTVMKQNEKRLTELAAKTFGRDEDEVSAATFSYLMAALDKSGLTSEGKGVAKGNTKNSNDLQEVAWRVGKNGKMEHILNLLYILESDPVLHRIENLAITPREKNGPFRVEFDYVALSLATRKGPQFAATRPSDAVIAVEMQSERRKIYDVIPERDIFRRYIKRIDPPPAPPVAAAPRTTPRVTPQPPSEPTAKYRICGLPTFKGQPEIWVVNEIDVAGGVIKYKEGEKLLGWEIVMVDYRPMPDPDKPELLSPARVIVRIDADYWAIEGDQYVSAKRILKDSDLPSELRVEGDQVKNR